LGSKSLDHLYGVNGYEIVIAVIYSTVYFVMFYVGFEYVIRNKKSNGYQAFVDQKDKIEATSHIAVFAMALFAFVVYADIYKYLSGRFYGFGTVGDTRTIMENIYVGTFGLHYLLLFIFLYLSYYRRRRYFIFVVLLVFLITFESFMTTAKANFIVMTYVYLFFTSISGKKINFYLILVVISFLYFFSVYSYVARYSGSVFDVVNLETVENTLITSPELSQIYSEKIKFSLVNRFELLDNLIIMINGYENIEKGIYYFGSIVELLNVVPRFLWEEKPKRMYFNYFVLSNVLNKNVNAASSVGKIGESYLIFSFFGAGLGLPVGMLFAYLYLSLLVRGSSIARLVYATLFFTYFAYDDYMFQSTFSVFFLTTIVVGSYMLFKIFRLRFVRG